MLASVLGATCLPTYAQTNWTGTTSTNWFTGSNWNTGVVPTAGDSVILNTITPNPTVVSGGAAVGNILAVGQTATGALTIQNNGTLNITGADIGNLAGSQGTATVTGAGSVWTNSSLLSIGTNGTGALTIANGGVVSNTNGFIASLAAGSQGTVTVTGTGSTWTNSIALFVGRFGTGSLTIADGSTVSVVGGSGTAFVANQVGSIGSLNIGAAPGNAAVAPGTLNAATVAFGAGSGTLNFNHTASNYVFAPTITGNGAVNVFSGTTILTGANTYTGGSTVNGGTLAVSADNNLGNASGGLSFGGGTLQYLSGFTSSRAVTLNAGGGTFDTNGNNATLLGNIGGTGGLTKIGTGKLTLSGNNGYAGNTVLSAGTLAVGSNTALGAGTLVFSNGTTLQAAASGISLGNAMTLNGTDTVDTFGNSLTLAGAISGPGGLTKSNLGNLTLTGPSTYLGPTNVLQDALVAGGTNVFSAASAFTVASGAALNLNGFSQTIGSLAGAGEVNNTNGAAAATLTTGGDNTSTTFSGVIKDGGSAALALTKTGTGTLTLPGANTYSGATTINAGTLIVDGGIASSAVTVNSGGTLAGTGTVGATTIMSGGTFAPGNSPGNSPGTMTVAGNLAFQSGALYLVQVNPSTSSSANVTAGGSATLAGSVQAAFASGSYASRTYTIVSAAGGRGGTFDSLSTNLPAGFTASLSYTSTDAILNLTAALGTGGLSGNQANVANALNNFFNSGGTLPPNFVTIFGLTGGNLGAALSQISGEAATGSQQAAFQLGGQFLDIMLDPFVDGGGGIAAFGPALGFAPERAALPEEVALAYARVLKAPVYKAPVAPLYNPHWTAWGGGFGGANKTSGDGTLGSNDLSARAGGVTGGFDYHFSRDSVLGFALAGGGTNWSLAQGLGGGNSEAFQAGLYGATRFGPAYLAAAFAYTNHWMATDRVAFAADHLTAKFDAQSLGGRVEGGYRFATDLGALAPYAALQVQSFHTPAYSETDVTGGGFALSYNARTGTDTRSELGARFDRAVPVSPAAVLALRARLAWAHDWVSDPSLAAVFQTLPGASFIVNGAVPAANSALASAGAELRLANGISLLGKFDGEFAAHSSTYGGTGAIRYAW